MHYHAEVWLESVEGDLESLIEQVMAPYYECLDVDYRVTTKACQIKASAKGLIEKHPDLYEGRTDHAQVLIDWEGGSVDKDGNIGYWWNSNGFWDWWQIGGRWKGVHVPDYDPDTDLLHMETCRTCGGTGKREPDRDCFTCDGSGEALAWPTTWLPHKDDIMPVYAIPEDLSCYTLIVDDKVFHIKEWNREKGTFDETGFDGNVKRKLKELGIYHGYVVTVDYHC